MKINKRTFLIFIAAIILQIAILFSMVIFNDFKVRSGTKIIVKTVPVDPRSLFRGDYINLNYEFSRIDLNKVKSSKTYFYNGDKVFVKLAKVGSDWGIAFVSDAPIKDLTADEVVIVGNAIYRYYLERSHKYIDVIYGIESYFVPEGQGKYIENQIAKKRVTVELSVDKQGFASVCRLFIDGQEVKFY